MSHPHCIQEDRRTNSMPKFWEFLTTSVFEGTERVREITYDLWATNVSTEQPTLGPVTCKSLGSCKGQLGYGVTFLCRSSFLKWEEQTDHNAYGGHTAGGAFDPLRIDLPTTYSGVAYGSSCEPSFWVLLVSLLIIGV